MQAPQYLLIDSIDRIHYSQSTNDFVIQFNPSLDHIKSIKLKALFLPLTHYNVNDTNNVIYFTDGSTEYIATLVNGIYDAINILPAIKAAMESTPYAGTITATYDDIAHLYLIESSTNISLQFGSYTSSSIASLLGYANVDTPLGLTHLANVVCNLSVPEYFFINLSGVNSNVRTTNSENSTFIVFTNTNSGRVNYYFENTHYMSSSRGNTHPLQVVRVTLKERGNRIFDINGVNWSMLLQLTYWD